MLDNAIQNFTIEINKVAKANALKKLEAGGVDYQIVTVQKFNELVEIYFQLAQFALRVSGKQENLLLNIRQRL